MLSVGLSVGFSIGLFVGLAVVAKRGTMWGLGDAKSFQWVAVGCNGLAMFQHYAKGCFPCECGGGSLVQHRRKLMHFPRECGGGSETEWRLGYLVRVFPAIAGVGRVLLYC